MHTKIGVGFKLCGLGFQSEYICGRCAGGRRRARAFGRALAAHIGKMRIEPGAYGRLGLSDLFEMREECLREFGFSDVYR